MQDDNLAPNDGSFFYGAEPVDQIVSRKKEKAKTLEALSVINDLLAHFDERISFRDQLSSINIDISRDPALHQKTCEVNALLKEALIEERSLLEDLVETHAINR